jgi:multisubunit Na+/H+ antiporter MnhE subunit
MGGFIATARNAPLSVPPRTVIFFLFWLILSGTKPADFVVGALAAVAVTWVSLLLLLASRWRLSPVALARLVLREFVKSAGVKS